MIHDRILVQRIALAIGGGFGTLVTIQFPSILFKILTFLATFAFSSFFLYQVTLRLSYWYFNKWHEEEVLNRGVQILREIGNSNSSEEAETIIHLNRDNLLSLTACLNIFRYLEEEK